MTEDALFDGIAIVAVQREAAVAGVALFESDNGSTGNRLGIGDGEGHHFVDAGITDHLFVLLSFGS